MCNKEYPSLDAEKKFRKDYITSTEIARCVGVSVVSVFNARKSGKLPGGFSVGKAFVWERKPVEPLMQLWKMEIDKRREHQE
jgi:hypothetical protein